MMDDDGSEADPSPPRDREIALTLMRMALALLDRSREPTAAARLQHAIDTVGTERPWRFGER